MELYAHGTLMSRPAVLFMIYFCHLKLCICYDFCIAVNFMVA